MASYAAMGMRGQIFKMKAPRMNLCCSAFLFFSFCHGVNCQDGASSQLDTLCRRRQGTVPGTVTQFGSKMTCVARDSAGSLPASAGTVLRPEGPVARSQTRTCFVGRSLSEHSRLGVAVRASPA
jgi:hypothetical protein